MPLDSLSELKPQSCWKIPNPSAVMAGFRYWPLVRTSLMRCVAEYWRWKSAETATTSSSAANLMAM